MATWPESLEYGPQSWAYEPTVSRTEYSTGNTRQRSIVDDDDYRFSVTMRLTSSELGVFEDFVLDDLNSGADEYEGPYYVGGAGYTGTLQIVNGVYNLQYLSVDYWAVSFEFDVKGRDMTNESNAYALVNELGGFDAGLNELMDALEIAINTSGYYP